MTKNLADFLANVPGQNNIAAQHPDALITHLLNLDTPVALGAIRKARASLKNPPKPVDDHLDTLSAQELPHAVAFLRKWQQLL